jgi:hypothetical protein
MQSRLSLPRKDVLSQGRNDETKTPRASTPPTMDGRHALNDARSRPTHPPLPATHYSIPFPRRLLEPKAGQNGSSFYVPPMVAANEPANGRGRVARSNRIVDLCQLTKCRSRPRPPSCFSEVHGLTARPSLLNFIVRLRASITRVRSGSPARPLGQRSRWHGSWPGAASRR